MQRFAEPLLLAGLIGCTIAECVCDINASIKTIAT